MARQHHFVVYGVENQDGTITFEVEGDENYFPDGSVFDDEDEDPWGGWMVLDESLVEENTRIVDALYKRLRDG